MEKKLFLLLFLMGLNLLLFAQVPHPIYVEVLTSAGEHPENAVTFIAWLDDNPTKVVTEESPNCTYYYNSGAYNGTLVIQCSDFFPYWNIDWYYAETLHIIVVSNQESGEADFPVSRESSQFFGDMYGAWSQGEGITLSSEQSALHADFSASIISGNAPLTVNFTDLSQNEPTNFYWDFNNDGIFDSNEQNPTYTYEDAGVYRVYLYESKDGYYPDAEIKNDYILVNPTNVNDNELQITDYKLSNYPNPFNPETTISFNLTQKKPAKIEIYNLKGQKVKELMINDEKLGINKITWNGKDDSGKAVGSGVYFYGLNVNGKVGAVKKCVLMK